MRYYFLICVCLFLFACSDNVDKSTPLKIVAFGDSLTSGHGLDKQNAFPAQLEARLKDEGYTNITVVNKGISGDTTVGGIKRIQSVLDESPDIVILELGINDAFKRIKLKETRKNLVNMINTFNDKNITVLLAGMNAPLQIGLVESGNFSKMYTELSEEYDVVFYPFFLRGVAGKAKLNQTDRAHPNALGVQLIVKNILPYVEEAIAKTMK